MFFFIKKSAVGCLKKFDFLLNLKSYCFFNKSFNQFIVKLLIKIGKNTPILIKYINLRFSRRYMYIFNVINLNS